MKYFFTIIALAFGISVNAQITWNMGMNISTNTYSNMHPRMALDRLGNPLVIWGKMSDESVYFSKWNGTMFTTPVKLNGTLTVAAASWMGADIASHGDTVYVVMKETPEAETSSHIYIVKSFNGGMSFTSPLRLDNIADSISRFPTITTDDIGNPIVAFMKFNNSFMDSRWVVTKSSDYGNSFSIDNKASGWGNSAEVCDCCPGAIISEGNTCAMLYRDNNSNIRDSWVGISNNNATTFTSGFALENNDWMLMSCPSSGPDGVIIGDTLYSTFMNGGSGNYRNYLSKTSISTGTIGSVTNLTGTITGLSQQNFPRIASDGNAMAVVWKQTVSGAAQLPILFTNDILNGFPASYDTVDLDNITNADVAMRNGKLYVVWQDDASGTVKYRSGTYTQIITGINKEAEYNFSIFPNPATDKLNIAIPDNKIVSINIFNSLGEKIYSTQANSNLQIETSNFANGLYFIQVIQKSIGTQNKLFTQKFIKQ